MKISPRTKSLVDEILAHALLKVNEALDEQHRRGAKAVPIITNFGPESTKLAYEIAQRYLILK